MSGLLRTLKSRIRSVENTKKITRAMEMVAAAKLRRYQTMMSQGRDYALGLESLLKRVSSGETDFTHSFLETREEKRIAHVVFTSDTGLCGSFNLDLINLAHRFTEKQKQTPVLCAVGKFGMNALKRLGHSFQKSYTDIRTSQVEETVIALKTYLEELYISGEIDAIYVTYSHCLSSATYEETTVKLLPLEQPVLDKAEAEKQANAIPYIFEPDEAAILKRLIPLFFEAKVRQIFLESFVSEQIARMRAMHQATENAKEMIDSLVLLRNKVRQAAITKEIIEIVSGSQALKN